jgi:hypothetical protein
MSNPIEPHRSAPLSRVSRHIASVVTGVLFMAALMWQSPPADATGVAALVILGALFGVLWAWLFGVIMRRIGLPVW